jgi:hypothetical protein
MVKAIPSRVSSSIRCGALKQTSATCISPAPSSTCVSCCTCWEKVGVAAAAWVGRYSWPRLTPDLWSCHCCFVSFASCTASGFLGLLSGVGLKRARYCLASLRVELALSRSKKKSCHGQEEHRWWVETAWHTLWASLSLFSPLGVLVWLLWLDRLAAREPNSRCKHFRVSGCTLLRSVGRHPAIVHGLSTLRERESVNDLGRRLIDGRSPPEAWRE